MREITRQIGPAELQEIDRRVASAASIALPNRTQCRDCIAYSISVQTADRSISIRAGDDQLAGSGAAPLVEVLSRVLGRLLSEP